MRVSRTGRVVLTFAVALALLLGVAAPASHAETVTPAKPVPVSGKKLDKAKFAGRVVSYDDDGFELRVKADETETIRWDELDVRTQYAVRKLLLAPKDAAGHVALGKAMLGIEGGKEWAEKAFAVALKLDAKLKEAIETAKNEIKAATPPAKKGGTGEATAKSSGGGGDMGGAGGKPTAPKAGAGGDGVEQGGPQMVGGVEAEFWGKLTEEQQAAAVAELKAFAGQTQERMNKELTLNETKFFLFYSDLDAKEAKNWSGLLDQMYVRLAELFGVDPKSNIWRGKALVFVFKNDRDYSKFQSMMHDTDAAGSAGMCHTFGNGLVHIAFYRQAKELEFAHVLVHESVHGFVHRYKTPNRIPSWVNEGLAEWISTQLLFKFLPNRAKEVRYHAQYFLKEYRGTGGLLDTPRIEAWQYPVSEMLTTFLMEKNKRGYVSFVNDLKDGKEFDAALEANFKGTRQQLVPAFGEWLGVRLEE